MTTGTKAISLILMGALLALGSLGQASRAWGLDKVRLRLLWVPQAQFAGYYLAHDAGIYAEHGLEVEILPGGPLIDPLEELSRGTCDFALAWLADGLRRSWKGQDLAHLAQVFQKSSLMLVAFADSGIRELEDLDKKSVGLWGDLFSVAPRALFRSRGIRVREVRQSVSMAPFMLRAIDAASAMRYNEFHKLYQYGVDWDQLTVFELAELGVNFPEDGIYASGQTWRENPGLCRRMVRASLAGWRLALKEPQRALDAVMKRVRAAQEPDNRPHQAWMLDSLAGALAPASPDGRLGRLSPADLRQVNRVLLDQGFIGQPVIAGTFAVPAGEPSP